MDKQSPTLLKGRHDLTPSVPPFTASKFIFWGAKRLSYFTPLTRTNHVVCETSLRKEVLWCQSYPPYHTFGICANPCLAVLPICRHNLRGLISSCPFPHSHYEFLDTFKAVWANYNLICTVTHHLGKLYVSSRILLTYGTGTIHFTTSFIMVSKSFASMISSLAFSTGTHTPHPIHRYAVYFSLGSIYTPHLWNRTITPHLLIGAYLRMNLFRYGVFWQPYSRMESCWFDLEVCLLGLFFVL